MTLQPPLRTLQRWAHALGLGVRRSKCLALFGRPNSRTDLEGWYRWTLEWFDRLGHPADQIGIVENDQDESGMIALEAGNAKLERDGFKGVQSINLKSSRPVGGMETGYVFSALLSARHRDLVICLDDDMVHANAQFVIDLAVKMRAFLEFDYGISYQRPFRLGPMLYALGVSMGIDGYGLEEKRARTQIAKWFHAAAYFQARNDSRSYHLRDVYPLNILSRPHLDSRVGSTTLEAWIQSTTKHGTLLLLADDCWVWEVEQRHLCHVQAQLRAQELLVAFRDDIPPLRAL